MGKGEIYESKEGRGKKQQESGHSHIIYQGHNRETLLLKDERVEVGKRP
jgi:hypothetical protein